MEKKKKGIIVTAVLLFAVVLLFATPLGYLVICKSAIRHVESVKIPEDSEIYLDTKAEVSDIYWIHVRAEKVIRVEEGDDYVTKFIKDNNSPLALANISVHGMSGMSDMEFYDFDMLSEDEQNKLLEDGIDKYVRIEYERKLLWVPTSWYFFDKVSK